MHTLRRYQRRLTLAISVCVIAVCGCTQTDRIDPVSTALAPIHELLPGDYLGQGPRGDVYHRIVKLEISEFDGEVFYHHVSRQNFGGEAFQKKYYVFDSAGRTMHSTVILGTESMPDGLVALAAMISGLAEDQLLRFPDDCRFVWSEAGGAFTAELTQDRCSYDSPAFGAWVTPQMTYQLDSCGLEISEAMYRRDGSPVFPPGKADNRRQTRNGQTLSGC